MHAYALVLTIIFVVAWFPVQALLHKYRRHNFIKTRGYFFLVVQDIGLLISGTATAQYSYSFNSMNSFTALFVYLFYISSRPIPNAALQGDFNCYVFFTLSWTGFPLFALPFFLRVWEYCVNFHISAVRAKLSVSDFQVCERRRSESVQSSASSYLDATFESDLTSVTKTSWFYRHRWTNSRSFLLKFFLVASWIYMFPALLLVGLYVNSQPHIYQEGKGCKSTTGVYEVLAIFIFSFVIAGVLLIALIRKARDTFYIKLDMLCVVVTWFVLGVTWLGYSFFSTPTSYGKMPNSFLLFIAFFLSMLSTMVLPLVLVYKNPCPRAITLQPSPSLSPINTSSVNLTNPIEEFNASLQLPHFRNAFHKFLVLQFCAESLLFYETVTNWKNSFSSYSRSKAKYQARAIFSHFLNDQGICTINVSSDSVNSVEKRLDAEDITPDLFDDPLKETTNLMFTNSYYPFMKSTLFPNTKEVSLKAIM